MKMTKKLATLFLALIMVMAMSMGVFAAGNYTSSVEQKIAPSVSEEQTYAVAADGSKTVITVDELSITAVSGEDSAQTRENLSAENQVKYDEAQEKLEAAYEEVAAADSIQSIVTDTSNVLDADKTYVCSDLLDVTFYDDMQDLVDSTFAAGGSIQLTFEINATAGAVMYVATKCDNEWVVLDADKVINNGDGSVSVTFEAFCPIMFLSEVDDAGEVVVSPQTSDVLPMYGMMAVACLVAAGGIFAATRRKNA